MKRDNKGISPVVGTILLIAITISLAGVVAMIVSGLSGPSSTIPHINIQPSATGISPNGTVALRLDHLGGDSIPMSELTIKAEKIDNNLVVVDMSGPSVFSISDTETGTYVYDASASERTSGVIVRIVIIHNASKMILVDARVQVM